MAAFVLDASVAVSWCFPGDPIEDTPYSQRILKELPSSDALVPEIWPFEIANAIFVASSKRKRITGQQITEYLNLLKALPIRVESQDLWANFELESWPASETWPLTMLPIWIWRGAPVSLWQLRIASCVNQRLLWGSNCSPDSFLLP